MTGCYVKHLSSLTYTVVVDLHQREWTDQMAALAWSRGKKRLANDKQWKPRLTGKCTPGRSQSGSDDIIPYCFNLFIICQL